MINTAKIQEFLDMPNARLMLFFKKVTICSLFDIFPHLLCVFCTFGRYFFYLCPANPKERFRQTASRHLLEILSKK